MEKRIQLEKRGREANQVSFISVLIIYYECHYFFAKKLERTLRDDRKIVGINFSIDIEARR